MSRKKRRSIRHILIPAVAAIALIMLGAFGWQWASGLMVEEVQITGYRHASLEELRELIAVDSTMPMLDVNPDSVATTVGRHPWVARAEVTRWPTGRLRVSVQERTPVAIAIDRSGAPSRYLDAEGVLMPLVAGAVYDVPTIMGTIPVAQEGTAAKGMLRAFLAALERVPREVSALIGNVEIRDGEIWIRTIPRADGESVPVRLGRDEFDHRLIRMHAFWHRAVVTQPEKQFAVVDLRFNSQVVTRESERKR